jgi:hypothetical protein
MTDRNDDTRTIAQLRARLDEALSADVPALSHVSTGATADPWPWSLLGRAR